MQGGGETFTTGTAAQRPRLTLKTSSLTQDDVLRRNSNLAAVTPRGNLPFSTIIRASFHEETKKRRGDTWRLEFDDDEVERTYHLEAWNKTRWGYIVISALVFLGASYDVANGAKGFRRPWVLMVLMLFITVMAYASKDRILPPLFWYNIIGPSFLAVGISMDSLLGCGNGFVTLEDCRAFEERGELPVLWILFPIYSLLMSYFAPVSFSQGLISRLALVFASALNMAYHYTTAEHLGVLLTFCGSVLIGLKRLYTLESRDRALFLDAHFAIKRLNQQQEQQQSTMGDQKQAEMNLMVRNAMRLTFPENPFHDEATEQRVERVRLECNALVQDPQIGGNLKPANNVQLPKHLLAIGSKVRGVRIAPFKLHMDNVVVHSIMNLEVLESDSDLKAFIETIRDASDLADIPGLTPTFGYCLSPCTFVIEENPFGSKVVTLHDLALELGSKELKLDWCFFKPLAACLSGTLAVLHRNGVLHRNVSSHVICLTSRETCLLPPVCFYHTFPEARRKRIGEWCRPPECQGSADASTYTASSEVFAFCVVAWEMLVGPFSPHVTPFAVPATVPKHIVSLIIDGLSVDPDGRPTMEELFDAFNGEDIIRDSSVASADVFENVLKRLEERTPEKLPPRKIKSSSKKPPVPPPALNRSQGVKDRTTPNRVHKVKFNFDEEETRSVAAKPT